MNLLADKNAVYLFTAYGVFIGALTIYALFLWLRHRALDREAMVLDEVEREQRGADAKASRMQSSS
ncbi:MAG: hypothetical protein NZL91_03565 [Thermoflexales bacterium]|nr:hypothetical protein [Thermoflexales bacterium]MCS7324810.1 hypothetical protein [Thermoflexales bacterium]MCX7939154.1 hypothetical protein [Thermoflexales bacterium]MDW8053134.1 hypothetical protein [Anaerolineae bacterium]MDW8291786.1 hypothetical protein [Anaerolineae bacterium]